MILALNNKKSTQKGFTLVELLVAISIVAILAIVGLTIFSGLQKNARDARRKGDIDAIAKAYETKYNPAATNRYPQLTDLDFAGGKIPQNPSGDAYADFVPAAGANAFKICAVLENGNGNADTDGNYVSPGPLAVKYCRSNQQ